MQLLGECQQTVLLTVNGKSLWADWLPLMHVCRDNAKAILDVETTAGQVKQAQSVVPPMERLVQGLEKQQADTLK